MTHPNQPPSIVAALELGFYYARQSGDGAKDAAYIKQALAQLEAIDVAEDALNRFDLAFAQSTALQGWDKDIWRVIIVKEEYADETLKAAQALLTLKRGVNDE